MLDRGQDQPVAPQAASTLALDPTGSHALPPADR